MKWERNIWTGTYYANVPGKDHVRLARIGHQNPTPSGITFLYRLEDFSNGPMRSGTWERSIARALKSRVE